MSFESRFLNFPIINYSLAKTEKYSRSKQQQVNNISSHRKTMVTIIHDSQQYILTQLIMGNATETCQTACIQDCELVVHPGDEIFQDKRDKLQPITFEEPKSIESDKIDIKIAETPTLVRLVPVDNSKTSGQKISKLDLDKMIVINESGNPIRHIMDELIDVPFSVIRLTISGELRKSIDYAGKQHFSKYEKADSPLNHWKLHKKGYYIVYLGEDLYGVLSSSYYYEGALIEINREIVPHDEGILITQGGVYSGSFNNGKAEGKGVYRDPNLKSVFKGTWKGGEMVQGTIENTQFKFQGTFNNLYAHGNGKMTFKEQSVVYNGKFVEGVFKDERGYLESNNYIYEGAFENGKKQGQGCLVEKEQSKKNQDERKKKYRPAEQFVGKWHRDCFEGEIKK